MNVDSFITFDSQQARCSKKNTPKRSYLFANAHQFLVFRHSKLNVSNLGAILFDLLKVVGTTDPKIFSQMVVKNRDESHG